ncbi:LPXTG-motif cell wall anchor domain-containing protein [Intestinibacter bartlettii DSM 16795]|jgi:LPXTG-motif cell wall-anchored protein|uniref:NEAT domain-containing protein n=1 Tax=Intestinibacter bartlettii TaxID=261299 RepID=UPI00016315AF|nr:NEAT domain-containing protein [Intestinibacter bartlettii]EDQ96013.1 LPXTG-motif cell wall anchor domain protein [Intestinibacter bartlettii DSM 16795]UWO79965.1 NEAT domain-containing protein [Intestinibacter bartlettii]SKA51480.1 LPXTG-motif cell wall anchor domain-containing protein [Intestinibacter bartlettii DSM 16795]
MIFKNKKFKTAMATLAILTIFGGTVSSAYAAELTNSQSISVNASVQRVELKTTLKHDTEDKDSSANSYLKESYLKIENGKRYMVLVLSSGKMMKSVVPSINGESVEYTNDLDGDTRTISFEIKSLQDDIRINFQINPFGNFVVNANCRVKSEIVTGSTDKEDKDDTVTGPTQKPETPDNSDKEDKEDKDDNTSDKEDKEDKEDKDDTVTGPTQKPETPDNDNKEDNKEEDNKEEDKEDSSNSTYKNGYYQVKNIVILDNEVGYSMVRGLLNETSNLEIRDGKYYLTFEMGQSSLMKDIVIKANSKELKYTKKNVGNDTIRITVEIPSLSSKLNISTYVTMMGKNVDFDLKLNQSTLKFVSSNEEGQLPGNNNNAGNNNGSNDSNNDSNTGNDNNAGGNITETVKGKLYTIKNEVIHENQTGKEMARKYLNSTSKIEEINGELYLTLTFTGTDLMNNHKFYVNGKSVSYTSSTSGNSKSYRFKINSLNDDIKVSAFIVPMSRNVEFGVKLLKDTYTFVKDFDASNDSNNAGNDSDNGNGGSNFDDMMNGGGNFEGFEDEKLPQTGSVINAESMLMGGSLITALGAFVGRRKRK